jgi:putative PIN family toxin of toxin-antitoxin system
VRAVLDASIIVSALLSPQGAPAKTLLAWREGRFELIASPALLDELERVLGYPKLRRHIPPASADAVIALLEHEATIAADVVDPVPRSPNPDDDYLIALAERERAALVSGDADVLALRGQLPVFGAGEFLEWLDRLSA